MAAETRLDQRKENRSDDEACQRHGALEEQEPGLWEAGQAETRCAPKPKARVLGGSEGHGLVVARGVPGCAESQLLLQLQSGALGLVQLRGQWAAGEDGPNVAICWGFQQSPVPGLVPGWGEGMHEGFSDLTERKWLGDLRTAHTWFVRTAVIDL